MKYIKPEIGSSIEAYSLVPLLAFAIAAAVNFAVMAIYSYCTLSIASALARGH